jgi:multidrug resistance efflux pump
MSIAGMKIRQDLILSRQEQRGTVYFVVKDPRARRFFRFKEPEEFIIRHLDRAHSPEAIQEKFREQFGADLTAKDLAAFISRLAQFDLLEETSRPGHSPPRRSLLYLRFKVFDPDRLLNWLAPRTRPFFTSSFLWLSAALVLMAMILTLLHSEEIARETPQLLRGSSLLLIYLTIFGIGFTHELAHGLTCKRYGGEVREMGFMLMFFIPAFYCNVSDSWLFPKKRQRLVVLFAGAYWQVVLWAVATVIWRLTAPETAPHLIALIVMATCGVHTLFNLNPLIKLDGYYLLSDYLEIPNLRAKAFGYLVARIRSILGTTARNTGEVSRRERRIYLVYGLLAGAYSIFLLGFIALRFSGYLIRNYQGLGFILFMVMLMILFKKTLKKTGSRTLAAFRLGPGVASSIKTPLKLGAVLLALAVLFLGRMELKVTGEFNVFPVHNADVRAEVEGIIEEIHADEGDVVQEGQLIALLSDRDYRAEFRQVNADIDEKQARLKMLEAGARPEEIDVARTAMQKAQERLKYGTSRRDMLRKLYNQNLLSRHKFEEAQEEVAVRRKELEEAKGKLKLLEAGSRPEEIEALQAEIMRLTAQQSFLEEKLALVRVVSPNAGVITTHKFREKVGQHVEKGDLIAEVHDLKSVTAEIAVPEKEISEVEVGQKVVLKVRAYPQTTFVGKVTSIAPAVTKDDERQVERTIRVTTQIDNLSLLLKPEMTGNAKIYTGERRIVDIMTRRLARYVKVEFWSWW